MQPCIFLLNQSHFEVKVLLFCHLAFHFSLNQFSTVFGCLTVSSVLTHWYTQRTPLAGVHARVPVVLPPSVSQIKIPFTRFCLSCSPLPHQSHTFCKVSVCNLDKLTGLHSGEITASRTAFLSFTSAWITLASGSPPSTAGEHVSSETSIHPNVQVFPASSPPWWIGSLGWQKVFSGFSEC